MAYKTYLTADLSAYSGRPEASYTDFAESSAIPQALLLFKIATCLASPEDLTPDQNQLIDFAIAAMADHIVLARRYAEASASPFNSESIGSYSYSKTASAVRAGQPTGVGWFDTAVGELSVCDAQGGDIAFGGIEMFEHDGKFVKGALGSNTRFLSPAEVSLSSSWGFDPGLG